MQCRNREWQVRKISLRTQLQGASGPCLVVLPRNPSPWQCVQVSFAAAIVSEGVGQGIGLVDSVRSCREVVQEFMEDFAEALERMRALAE